LYDHPYHTTQKLKRIRLNWTFADLVDLEFFCTKDEQLRQQHGEVVLRQQDRTIYFARQQEFDSTFDNRGLVRRWLSARRMQQHSTPNLGPLPGKIWRHATIRTRWLALIWGLLAGVLSATFLLRYNAERIVNISNYFAVFIGLQIVLLGVLLSMALLRRVIRNKLGASLLCQLAAKFLKKRFTIQLQRKKVTDQDHVLTALEHIKKNREDFNRLYFWPAFILLQLFGCGFNIGALFVTLFKINSTNIACSWQTPFQMDPTLMADIARWIAIPWSWFMPIQVAYPRLEQIENSQIILTEKLHQFATDDLGVWWPFLILAVFTYGLLPRLLLLFYGLFQTKRKLNNLHFESARFRHLQQRMLNPVLYTAEDNKATLSLHAHSPLNKPKFSHISEESAETQLLLIPTNLWNQIDQSELEQALKNQNKSGSFWAVHMEQQTDEELYIFIARLLHKKPSAGIILLQEAWLPPTGTTINLMSRIHHELPRHYPLSIVLIGKPNSETPLTKVHPRDFRLWRKNLHAIANPYLVVYPLISST
jgi:hypothetical protein